MRDLGRREMEDEGLQARCGGGEFEYGRLFVGKESKKLDRANMGGRMRKTTGKPGTTHGGK